MVLEALFAGMLMAVGAFAVKAGFGLHYLISRVSGRPWARAGIPAAFGLSYLGLFVLCFWIAGRWEEARPDGAIQGLLESGMILHVAASAGLAFWGAHLLRRPDHDGESTRGWVAMVVPCPVCMTVLILSMSAVRTFVPDAAFQVMLGVFGAFVGIALLTAAVCRSTRLTGGASPDRTLGWAMLLTAVYFFTSILVLPPVQDTGEIYGVAVRLATGGDSPLGTILGVSAAVAMFFGVGFLRLRSRVRRFAPWS